MKVQLPTHAYYPRHVVERTARLQLIQEPQSLLREAEGKMIPPRGSRDRRDLERAARSPSCLDALCQFGHSWSLKHGAQRQLHSQRSAHPRDNLRGEHGMATQSEKIIVNTDSIQLQNLCPCARDHFLEGSTRSHKLLLAMVQAVPIHRPGDASDVP